MKKNDKTLISPHSVHYRKPEVEIIDIELEDSILAGSPGDGEFG